MLANYERQKLINSIIFFSSKTRHCGITKLFKLLYFLDFEHFKQTGRSVTGLDYYAWKMGPVPTVLYNEIPATPEPDLAEKVSFKAIKSKNRNQFVKIEPKSDFEESFFSKRELEIMESLAKEYKLALAEDIIEATHLENLPWHRVYKEEKGKQELIPYEYAFKKAESDFMTYVKKENDEVVSNYSN